MLEKVGLSIVEVLNRMGLSDPLISQKLIDGLNAKREVGVGKDRKEVADHHAITKYIDMILKLKADYPIDKSKLELTGPGGKPLMPTTIVLIEKTYENCPLKNTGECPVRDKLPAVDEVLKRSDDSKKVNNIQEG